MRLPLLPPRSRLIMVPLPFLIVSQLRAFFLVVVFVVTVVAALAMEHAEWPEPQGGLMSLFCRCV